MSNTNDFLIFATGGGANVITQSTYVSSGFVSTGFSSGTAFSNQLNKVWRQSSTWANVLGLLLNAVSLDALDNGAPSTLLSSLQTAIKKTSMAGIVVVVPFSATPVFDASQGSKFEITLTGNVTSSTLINLTAGQSLTFTIIEDATGGRTFVPPGNLPLDAINTAINGTSIQKFEVASDGSTVRVSGPMMTTP